MKEQGPNRCDIDGNAITPFDNRPFLQALREDWPDFTFDSKVSLILWGMGAVSTAIAGIGGGLWVSGELAHIQNLKDIATPFLYTGGGGLGASAFGYATASAFCLFD